MNRDELNAMYALRRAVAAAGAAMGKTKRPEVLEPLKQAMDALLVAEARCGDGVE